MTRELPQPSEGELAILNVLWERGPSTVRAVHEALRVGEATRYTTTLKQLQVMAEKGLVERDDSQRSHVYSAAVDESGTKVSLLGGVIDRLFDGSVQKMVMHALQARDVNPEELKAIKRLLADRERRQ